MTHDEINRKISEFLEPLSPVVDAMDPHWIGVGEYSPKKAWRWAMSGSMVEWSALDYFTSEEANARLFDAMRAAHFKQPEADFASHFYTLCINLMNHLGDRKKFTILAFLKFAGIEAEL